MGQSPTEHISQLLACKCHHAVQLKVQRKIQKETVQVVEHQHQIILEAYAQEKQHKNKARPHRIGIKIDSTIQVGLIHVKRIPDSKIKPKAECCFQYRKNPRETMPAASWCRKYSTQYGKSYKGRKQCQEVPYIEEDKEVNQSVTSTHLPLGLW